MRTTHAAAVALILALITAACSGQGEPAAPSPLLPSAPSSSTTPSLSASLGAQASAAPTLTPPDLAGKFDVGDHSLYIECYGKTGPVMVLDSGSGGAAIIWKRNPAFIATLDNSYRRCVYDRANAGRSDRDSDPRTAATSADELHKLLIAADLPGPYVVVGRSFGGYVSRLFASAHPADVRALVLVETLTPEFHHGLERLLTPAQWADEVEGVQSYERPLDVIASTELVADAGLPDVPLLVIAGTKWHSGNVPWPAGWPGEQLDALWDEAQQTLAASVPGGRLVVFEGGDHSLQVSQPGRLAEEINGFLADLSQ